MVSLGDESYLCLVNGENPKIYYRNYFCYIYCSCCSDCYPPDFACQGLETVDAKFSNEGTDNEAFCWDEGRNVTFGGSSRGLEGCSNDYGYDREEVLGNQR